MQKIAQGDTLVPLRTHPLEQALIVLVSLQLIFMPWALGSMHLWSQMTVLPIAAAAFVLSLINRRYSGEYTREEAFRMIMWKRLAHFPIFWLGLALFAFMTLQGLNPAWIAKLNPGGGFATFNQPHIAWLPSGVEAPFRYMNTWRMLIIYGEAWMLACALWTGITRRQSVVALFTVIVANAALIGLVAFLERATGTRDVLWIVKGKASFFVGSFIYKNHAGAFFNLVLSCAVALTAWHHTRAIRRMMRTSPAPVFALFAFTLALVVIITYSRMATAILLVYAAVAAFFWLISLRKSGDLRRQLAIGTILLVMFGGVAAMGSYVFRFDTAITRMKQAITSVEEEDGASYTERQSSTKATYMMAKERIWTGWGTGSFRWVFPRYQILFPDIWWRGLRWPGKVRFWLDAHNDYAQLLAELGIIGCAIGVSILGSGIVLIIRAGGLAKPHILLLMGGLAMTLAHCWVDNHSTNPAILCTFTAVLILAVLWAQTEQARAEARDSARPSDTIKTR